MEFEHEFIHYPYGLLPVNWILHDVTHSTVTVLPHWHASLEISFTYHDSIDKYVINSTSYKTGANTVLLINPIEVHSVISSYAPNFEALTIQISYPLLAELIPDFEFMRFVTNPLAVEQKTAEYDELTDCLGRFYHEATKTSEGYSKILMMSIVYQLIYLLARDWMYRVDESLLSQAVKLNNGKVASMVSYIQRHYAEELSIEIIANKFEISSYYLSKLFKKQLDMGVMTYVQLVRVKNAQQLLRHTDKPIQVISDIVGFRNEKSFRLAFVKFFNKTPKKFRLENKAN